MKTIELSRRYWLKARKNNYHIATFQDLPGVPAYAGEKRGDKVKFVWNESEHDRHEFQGTIERVVKKESLAVLYLKDTAAEHILVP